jgi:hypothetical protein
METIQKENRLCMECGEELRGRVDQKFCGDFCRNGYHNKENNSYNSNIRRVNNILRKNRKILASCNPSGKRTIDAMLLAEEGFNFHYYTNVYETKKGTHYFFCYDQGYLKLENQQYMLVERQDYVR